MLNKIEKWSELRVVFFVHTAVFDRARNRFVKMIFLSTRFFLFKCGFYKTVFRIFWLRFFYSNIVLILGFSCFLGNLSSMLIWRFFS